MTATVVNGLSFFCDPKKTMELFGSDLRQPDIPRVCLRSFNNTIVWNWGKTLRCYDRKCGKYSTIAKEENEILAFTKDAKNRWVTSNDSKEISLYDSANGNLLDRQTLKRRITSLASFESYVVLGDKFGDIFIAADADLMKPSPFLGTSDDAEGDDGGDAAFEEPPSASSKEIEKGRRWEARESAKIQDEVLSNLSINGLLASITTMKIERITDDQSDGGLRYVVITADRDEKIRISRLPDLYRIDSILCGHIEFVTDFQLIPGTSLLVSCGADKTLRLWDISKDRQLAELCLDGVPFQVLAASHVITNDQYDVYVCLCGSRHVLSYQVNTKDYTLTKRDLVDFSHLTQAPLLALVITEETLLCLDAGGKLLSREKGLVGEGSDLVDELPYFVRFWKHDRDVSSNKRLRLS